ncbi:MAG TPA: thioredoxin domain-containing protein [Thermoanaerobaculia bacterium]|nr:thioredoxin domain-containing protein [Thermoanaerobaculia bacterium]
MKKTLTALAALLVAISVAAQEEKPAAGVALDAPTEKLVRAALPVCAGTKITRTELAQKLPAGLQGAVLGVQAQRPACEGQFLLAIAPFSGDYYLGMPWILPEDTDAKTVADKLQSFAWNSLHENFMAEIGRERTRNGLLPVTMWETTEHGKVPLQGEVDPLGKVFFVGHFHDPAADLAAQRLKALDPAIATAPAEGAAKPEVTVIEFSDFQCPSCKHASAYLDPIMQKYGERVRYIRYDVPLLTMHPWAYAAAAAGRAIYRQKPAAFWDYKKQVYENQDKLSTFTFDDFARGFAQYHELDVKKYDADLASAEIGTEILKGVGLAFSNDVRATPTYMVNGVYVDAGENGTALESYVASMLKK